MEHLSSTTPMESVDFCSARSHADLIADIVRLNVGGRAFAFARDSLLLHPDTLLGEVAHCSSRAQLQQLCPRTLDGVLFFERSPEAFERCVSGLYLSNGAHLPPNICASNALSELKFWKLKEHHLASCCRAKVLYMDSSSESDVASTVDHVSVGSHRVGNNVCARTSLMTDGVYGKEGSMKEEWQHTKWAKFKNVIWLTFETPGSNICSWFFMVISLTMVLTTMLTLVLSSMGSFKVPKRNATYPNSTLPPDYDEIKNRAQIIEYIDTVCVIYFTFEYLVRLFAAPGRIAFLRSAMSIIDFLAFFPFYIELALNQGEKSGDLGTISRSFVFIRILRVLRVLRALRILKVARYSTGFQSMGATLRRSWHELTLLIMFMLAANFIFSTAMYFIEEDVHKTDFHNIPEACWWCIITMTTVGYGDVFPKSWMGKLLAGAVSTVGIILLAFPVSIIVETFNEEYEKKTGKKGHDEELDQSEVRVFDGRAYLPLDVVEAHLAGGNQGRRKTMRGF